MTDIPENLQIIKTEHPSSPEKSPQNNIKERLNLHVKRRLNATSITTTEEVTTNLVNKLSEKHKETTKTKRTYQKRIDKVNTKILTDEEGRKNKRYKGKNVVNTEDSVNAAHGSNVEDDEINEADVRTVGRDKDKCPDVLNMVLNVKKRALLQSPEVHEFFNKIMDVIKS